MKKLASHCSDEQLLAFLDGELTPEMTSLVGEHLSRCWECRGRSSDIEIRAQQLVRLVGDSSFLGADRVQAAKQRFLAAAADLPLSSRTSGGVLPFRPLLSGGSRAMSFAVAAALVASLFLVWSPRPQTKPDPARSVAAAVRVEADSLRAPMHQDLQVQLREYSPKQTERNSRLEIWSDLPAKRFAAKWSAGSGPLQFAVWQPDARRRFRYDQRLKQAVTVTDGTALVEQPVMAAIRAASDFSNAEKRFETWLATRSWQPVSMAKDFSLFVSTEGVLLRSETKRIQQRTFTIMTATSMRGDSRVTMTLELDPETYVARAQEIRFASPRQDVALRFIALSNERLALSPASARVFQPDVPLIAKALAPAAPKQAVLPSLSELINLQANAEYQLHRIRACVDDSISVVQQTGSGVRISGVVDNAGRKEQILRALERVPDPRWMTVDIKTLDEAAAASKPSLPVTPEQALPSANTPVRVAVESLPLDNLLLAYFETHALPASLPLPASRAGAEGKLPESAKVRAAAYASAIVSLSQTSYRESWAIRRLAEKFAAPEMLSDAGTQLLQTMLRDHSQDLMATLQTLDNALRPLFGNGPSAHAAPEAVAAPIWPATALDIFQKAERTNKILFEMFAAGAAASTANAGAPLSNENPGAKALMEQLLRDLPDLTATTQQAKSFDFERALRKQTAFSHQQ